MAQYQDLEQDPGFAALCETELGLSLIDGAEFVAHALGERSLSVKYAQAMAATASCRDQRASGDCFKDMASKALCRLHELRKNDKATAYFNSLLTVRAPTVLSHLFTSYKHKQMIISIARRRASYSTE